MSLGGFPGTDGARSAARVRDRLPLLVGGAAFLVLFSEPALSLAGQWWSDPDASHGLLLAPLALVLAWRAGWAEEGVPRPALGLALLAVAVLLRALSELAAELYTMRLSMLIAVAAAVVIAGGVVQLVRWWLPAALLLLAVPLPEMVVNTVAFPLQLRASAMGAALLEWRQVPVRMAGNVIQIPGHSLFVTEACSGLRSLTALLSLGVLMGGLFLRSPVGRVAILAAAIPVAMAINGVRVFLTGFLVFFVDPSLGTGFMHYSEGWALFVMAFAILGAMTWLAARAEGWWRAFRGGSGPGGWGGRPRPLPEVAS